MGGQTADLAFFVDGGDMEGGVLALLASASPARIAGVSASASCRKNLGQFVNSVRIFHVLEKL